MRTPIPPFMPGEEHEKGVPDEWMQPVRDRVNADQHFDLIPCVWFCLEGRRCLHYDVRPDACRNFEINSDLCRLSRWDEGLT